MRNDCLRKFVIKPNILLKSTKNTAIKTLAKEISKHAFYCKRFYAVLSTEK